MDVPLILHLSAWCQAVPLGAALLARRALNAPRSWVVAWCAILVATDALSLYMGRQQVNNHWVQYISVPLQGGVILWALSLWHRDQVARVTIRAMIPLFLLTWAGLTVLVEDTRTFSTIGAPIYSLLGLGTAAFTLLSRSGEEAGPVARQDWFWISGGLALYFGTASSLGPVAAYLVKDHLELVVRAYEIKALTDIVAFLAIARGVSCPIPSPRSGVSSLPASSVSSSFSARSSRP